MSSKRRWPSRVHDCAVLARLTEGARRAGRRGEDSSSQSQSTLDRDDPKAQSLPANLLRSTCSASALDLDAQLLRLRKLFDAHNLYEDDATGTAPTDMDTPMPGSYTLA